MSFENEWFHFPENRLKTYNVPTIIKGNDLYTQYKLTITNYMVYTKYWQAI